MGQVIKMSSWKNSRMKTPKGKIGTVTKDDNGNGIYRILTVSFKDNTKEELWLANCGSNPEESRKWCWEFIRDNKTKKWVQWGR